MFFEKKDKPWKKNFIVSGNVSLRFLLNCIPLFVSLSAEFREQNFLIVFCPRVAEKGDKFIYEL